MRSHFKTENIVSIIMIATLGWVTTNVVMVKETQATITANQILYEAEHKTLNEYRDAVVRIDTNMGHIVSKLDNVEKQVLCSLKTTQEARIACL